MSRLRRSRSFERRRNYSEERNDVRKRSQDSRSPDRKRGRSRSPDSRRSSRTPSPRFRSRHSFSPQGPRGPGPWQDCQEEPEKGNRVHVGDLAIDTTEDELHAAFSKIGELEEVWVAKTPPVFAFVVYKDPKDADEAVLKMNGAPVGSSTHVRVSYAMRRRKGRGVFHPSMRCYTCGMQGHFSRDCGKDGSERPDNRGYNWYSGESRGRGYAFSQRGGFIDGRSAARRTSPQRFGGLGAITAELREKARSDPDGLRREVSEVVGGVPPPPRGRAPPRPSRRVPDERSPPPRPLFDCVLGDRSPGRRPSGRSYDAAHDGRSRVYEDERYESRRSGGGDRYDRRYETDRRSARSPPPYYSSRGHSPRGRTPPPRRYTPPRGHSPVYEDRRGGGGGYRDDPRDYRREDRGYPKDDYYRR